MREVIAIANQFKLQGNIAVVREYGNGNINETFLITTDGKVNRNFILQRINTDVFLDPASVMRNMSIVSKHIHERVQSAADTSVSAWKVPRIIQTHGEQDYWMTPEKEFWRVLSFIEDCECSDIIDNSEMAMQVGCGLGIFHDLVSDVPARNLTDTLKNFHVTPHYMNRYDQVMAKKGAHDSHEVNYCIEFVNKRRSLANVLEDAKKAGELPSRIIHGDPKVNNIMLEKHTGKAICMIDLDTVKPGLIQYDIGDCLRSGCNPLGEEAGAQWEAVYFDTDICRSVVQGYISQAKRFFTGNDYRYIYDSVRLIAFELGLRFFTDYLEGNVYFQDPAYPEQNLFRALVQFRLTESIECNERNIDKIIKDIR